MSGEMNLIYAAKNNVVNLHWVTGSEWRAVDKIYVLLFFFFFYKILDKKDVKHRLVVVLGNFVYLCQNKGAKSLLCAIHLNV